MLLYLAQPPRDFGPARAPPLLIGRADSQWRRRGGGDVTSRGRGDVTFASGCDGDVTSGSRAISVAGCDVTASGRDVTVTATGSVLWLQSEAGNAIGKSGSRTRSGNVVKRTEKAARNLTTEHGSHGIKGIVSQDKYFLGLIILINKHFIYGTY
jgi:hypothetical protein